MPYIYDDEDNGPMNEESMPVRSCRDVCPYKKICKANPNPFKSPFYCVNHDYYESKLADKEDISDDTER